MTPAGRDVAGTLIVAGNVGVTKLREQTHKRRRHQQNYRPKKKTKKTGKGGGNGTDETPSTCGGAAVELWCGVHCRATGTQLHAQQSSRQTAVLSDVDFVSVSVCLCAGVRVFPAPTPASQCQCPSVCVCCAHSHTLFAPQRRHRKTGQRQEKWNRGLTGGQRRVTLSLPFTHSSLTAAATHCFCLQVTAETPETDDTAHRRLKSTDTGIRAGDSWGGRLVYGPLVSAPYVCLFLSVSVCLCAVIAASDSFLSWCCGGSKCWKLWH